MLICIVQTVRGVSSSLLCFDDGSPAITPVQDDDQLGIVANLQPLVTASSDVSMYCLFEFVNEI